jgi:hypothetical protein
MGIGQNLFEQQLRAGCLLESANVEQHSDEDSDEIVFRFGEPDPAASSFVTGDAPAKPRGRSEQKNRQKSEKTPLGDDRTNATAE